MRTRSRPRNRWVVPLAFGCVLSLAAGCVVDEQALGPTATPGATAVVAATTAPQFEPTSPPAPTATPPPPPTATPLPTATPIPQPTPAIDRPPPLPTIVPAPDVTPSVVGAGPVSIPVGTTSFVLAAPRPVLQLSGHTLIYVDDDRQAEVDIFTPIADRDGTPLGGYDGVIEAILTDPVFAGLDELTAVTIAGLPTRVFEGTAISGDRAFYTDELTFGIEVAGWFPPVRLRMWVIDDRIRPIIVSAESLADPGQYSEAVLLATEILSTITFS